MPPLEAKKILFRQAAREGRTWRKGRWCGRKLIFVDVRKAHLNGKVPEDVFVYAQLPDGKVWRLRRWLYGMRPAASAWEREYSDKLAVAGFRKGKSSPTVFYREKTGCRLVVHGDDFTFLTWEDEVAGVIKDMKHWYDIKLRGVLGGGIKDDEDITILGRHLSWPKGTRELIYEADTKYAREVMAQIGVGEDSKGLDAPIEREVVSEGSLEDESELLDPEEAKRYRGIAATLNYLSLDRSDIQYAAKEVCRTMSQPRQSGWKKIKRLARYLKDNPRMVWKFGGDRLVSKYLDVYSDSDWAGDRRSRKSTSGGVAAIDGIAVKHWSSTQGSVALSVGEAEYYALVKAAAEGLGIQALAQDLGIELTLRIWVDSTTADAIASRIGLGKVRHMEVKYLWAQEAHQAGRFSIRKVAGEKNPADVLTKPKSIGDMEEKLRAVGGEVLPGDPWHDARRGRRTSWADASLSD